MDLLLNCDLGETSNSDQLRIESQVMPHIDQANIACGFHAGDLQVMDKTLRLAKQYLVAVGAHPSYPDTFNFGRKSMSLSAPDLIACLQYQIRSLAKAASDNDLCVSYVKPHGALYNDMMTNGHLRSAVMAAIVDSQACSTLMLQATADANIHKKEASAFGLTLYFEAFADRAYQDNGALVPRNQPGAILDKKKMLSQVEQLKQDGSVTTINDHRLSLTADTLCVHGDNPEAILQIRQIQAILSQ
ncbi:MAG: LamB/YcsF family protein [Porticoccaceae bacterium]|nr:LamB/YcsF family protein [Porticoccaceae bacterium]